MNLHSNSDLPLSAARQAAKELRAKVALEHDVAGETQERTTEALAKIEAARTVITMAKLLLPRAVREVESIPIVASRRMAA